MKIATILAACIIISVGCKDNQIPINTESAIDKLKGKITNDKLPEKSYDSALASHGFPKLLELAEQGDKKAQHFVAVAYLTGEAVPKNFSLAEKWARRAANQGSSASQYLMGMLKKSAITTEGVYHINKNVVLSYMWFSVAAANGNEASAGMREEIANIIRESGNNEWLEQGQSLATKWKICENSKCMDDEPDMDLLYGTNGIKNNNR